MPAFMKQSRPLPFREILIVLALFSLAALGIFLEKPTGAIQGIVYDKAGHPLPGAVFSVDNWPLRYEIRSDQQGHFKLAQIPVGSYSTQLRKKGYQWAYPGNVLIEEGKITPLNPLTLDKLEPNLYASLWDNTKLPQEKAMLSISGARVPKIYFESYQVDLKQFLESGGDLSQLDSTDFNPEGVKGISPLKNWQYEIPTESVPEFDLKTKLELPEVAGLYLIHATASSEDRQKSFAQNILLNKTDLGFLLKRDSKKLLTFVTTLKEGKPIANAAVSFFLPGQNPVHSLSNGQGIGLVMANQFPEGIGDGGIVLVSQGNSIAYGYIPEEAYGGEVGEGTSLGEVEDPSEKLLAMIYTERPLYRPGQKVYFKGILRKRDAQGIYQLPEAGSVSVRVEDPRGRILQDYETSLSTQGSFFGEFDLENEADLGYYRLLAVFEDREFVESFEVQEYRKPEFKVSIRGARDRYYAGDEIEFLVDTQYYFGAPAETELQYTLYRSAYYYTPPEDSLLPDLWVDESYLGGYGEFLQDGTLSTDAQGRAVVSYLTPPSDTDSSYTLRVVAKDLSNRQVETENNLVVTAGDFFFRTEKTQFLAWVDKPYRLGIYSRDYEDQARSVDYELRAEKQKWDPIAKDYEYKKSETLSGKTDASGRGNAELTLKKPGYYRLVLTGKDSQGRKVRFDDFLWVAGPHDSEADFGFDPSLRIIADRHQYQKGDTAHLFVVGPEANQAILLTVEGGELYHQELLTLDGFSKQIDLPLKPEWLPNVFVRVAGVGKKTLYSGEVQLQISPRQHFLEVQINSDKSQYRPGETVAYRIKTLDAQGQPAPAELSLGVVDESLYALKADSTNIQQIFWGLRPNRVGENYSFPGNYSGGIQKEDRNLLRKNFKDTAFWSPVLTTNEQGEASAQVTLPDNLTTWRATVIAATPATSVGQQKQQILATKPLIARIAAPRFFRQKDRVTLQAIVHNYTEQEQKVAVSLDLTKLEFSKKEDGKNRELIIPAKGVQSFNFSVEAPQAGKAKVALLAKGSQVNDGVELSIPILPYGIPDHHYSQGRIAPGSKDSPTQTQISLQVPPSIDLSLSQLKLTLDTTLVGQLLGSLDYLIQYPYGCLEQTMSRLLPALTIAKLYESLGYEDKSLQSKLPLLVKRGLKRVFTLQNNSGGWGWWKNDNSDPFMTAYALYGLSKIKAMGQNIDEDAFTQGRQALEAVLQAPWSSYNSFLLGPDGTLNFVRYTAVLMGIPLNMYNLPPPPRQPLSQSFWILSLLRQNHREMAVDAINTLKKQIQCEGDYCHASQANPNDTRSSMDVMATAWALQALVGFQDTDTDLQESLVRYLFAQRQGGRWRHTFETASVLYALAEYAKTSTVHAQSIQARLLLADQVLENIQIASPHFTRILETCAPAKPECQGAKKLPLKTGPQNLGLANLGESVLFYQSDFTLFSTDERLNPVDQGLKVQREYFRITAKRVPGQDGVQYETSPLQGPISRGETLGVRLTLSSSHPLEYVMLEDFLPSGFEVLPEIRFDATSEYTSEIAIRDEKITLFRNYLPAGTYIFNYALMPELEGKFQIMPAQAELMYQPEWRGSSANQVIEVVAP